ncbi:MAG: hypothetical protein NZT61_02050, partial [Deltaproteobacteria bacterium]|nr:hypothetical protein [Deltaproteobacteria bacterium]
ECLLGEVLFFFFTVNRNQMRDAWEDLSDFTEEMMDTVLQNRRLASESSPNYYKDPKFRPLDKITHFTYICRTSLEILQGIFRTNLSADVRADVREVVMLLPEVFEVYFNVGVWLGESCEDQEKQEWWITNFPTIIGSCASSKEVDSALALVSHLKENYGLINIIRVFEDSEWPISFRKLRLLTLMVLNINNLKLVKALHNQGFLEEGSVEESLVYLMEKLRETPTSVVSAWELVDYLQKELEAEVVGFAGRVQSIKGICESICKGTSEYCEHLRFSPIYFMLSCYERSEEQGSSPEPNEWVKHLERVFTDLSSLGLSAGFASEMVYNGLNKMIVAAPDRLSIASIVEDFMTACEKFAVIAKSERGVFVAFEDLPKINNDYDAILFAIQTGIVLSDEMLEPENTTFELVEYLRSKKLPLTEDTLSEFGISYWNPFQEN